jgi:hypothetical protein
MLSRHMIIEVQPSVGQNNGASFAILISATDLGNCVLHNLLVRHIALVTDQQLVHTLGGVAIDLLEPLLDVVEGVHIGDIVDDADAVGTAIVGGCDGAESLLASSIPLSLGRSVSA